MSFKNKESSSNNDEPESKPKNPDIGRNLGITLEEIFTGSTKKLKIKRQVLDSDGRVHLSHESITINTPPGCKEGEQFRFPNMGDEYPHRIPADLVFTIKYKEHPKFTRVGKYDIRCTEVIPYERIKAGVAIEIPSLRQSKPIRQVVFKRTSTENSMKIPNQGLPIDGDIENLGYLIIHFRITGKKPKDPYYPYF